MPPRPSRPCRHKGCKAIHRNANGYCDTHDAERASERRGSAGSYKNWYAESRWRELRRHQLDGEPLCAFCLKHGRSTEATICDHVDSHGGDREKFWGGPFQSLCKPCHDSTKQSMDRGVVTAYPEWLSPAGCELIIVFGPPGSGKSHYVEQRWRKGDSLIDLDSIKAELSGAAMYQAGQEWYVPAMRRRNEMLGKLKNTPSHKRVWFTTVGNTHGRRLWWQDKLTPSEVVLLDVPADICIARLKADPRRAAVLEWHIKAVKGWT